MVGTWRFHLSNGMAGLGLLKYKLGGITPFSSASTPFIRPAMLAAPSRWPIYKAELALGNVKEPSGSPYIRLDATENELAIWTCSLPECLVDGATLDGVSDLRTCTLT